MGATRIVLVYPPVRHYFEFAVINSLTTWGVTLENYTIGFAYISYQIELHKQNNMTISKIGKLLSTALKVTATHCISSCIILLNTTWNSQSNGVTGIYFCRLFDANLTAVQHTYRYCSFVSTPSCGTNCPDRPAFPKSLRKVRQIIRLAITTKAAPQLCLLNGFQALQT